MNQDTAETQQAAIEPSQLINHGYTYKNASKLGDGRMMVYVKGNVMLRYRANGLYRINPENKIENIGDRIETISQLQSLK